MPFASCRPAGAAGLRGTLMRTMMHVVVPVESGNATIKDGSLPKTMQETLDRVQAEAAYFTTDGHGRRCGYIFFDLKDPADIPVIAEPLFHTLNAAIEFRPAMNTDDMQRGVGAWASSQT